MNRYGRHGTRAWLRRHLRQRQQRASTSLVAAKLFIPVVVFNITVPAGVGKVIIIVSDEQGQQIQIDEMGANGQEYQLPEGRIIDNRKSEGIKKVEAQAKTLANRALAKINQKYGSNPVYLPESVINDYAADIVDKDISDYNFPTDRTYTPEELERAFKASFKQSLQNDKDYQCNFQTEDDWHISEIARKDKEVHDIRITDRCHYHDPGIIHAIEESGISLRDAYTNTKYFEQIQQRANKYAEFYSNPHKEVQQVDLATFLR